MKYYKFIFIVISLLLFSCGKSGKTTSVEDYGYVSEYEDGRYCAKVTYYNPNTGTESEYILEVEVENGELTTIYWNNGGWLDNSHFTPQDISDGQCSFTSDVGYEYTVRLMEKDGNCRGYSENPETNSSPNYQNNSIYDNEIYDSSDDTDDAIYNNSDDTFSDDEDY